MPIRRRDVCTSTLAVCAVGAAGIVPSLAFAGAINERAVGDVYAVRQPTRNTCWATVAAIMYSWRNKRSSRIEDVLQLAGPKYVRLFRDDRGLTSADKPEFLNALGGLKSEAPQSYSVEAWAKLVRDYGALWVTSDEGRVGRFSIHARVVTELEGDGSSTGTRFTLVDPADAQFHSESVSEFVAKFEKVARDDGAQPRPQVVHY